MLVAAAVQKPWDAEGFGEYEKYPMYSFLEQNMTLFSPFRSIGDRFIILNIFVGLKKIAIIAIAIGFAILIVISGTVIACKLRENSYHNPPSTVLLHGQKGMPSKGPLPAIPEGQNSHYRSLIRQPDPQAFPQQTQTMPRPQQCVQYGDNSDYNYDWKFGTAPWQRAENQGTVRV